jgi:hypothetical protein
VWDKNTLISQIDGGAEKNGRIRILRNTALNSFGNRCSIRNVSRHPFAAADYGACRSASFCQWDDEVWVNLSICKVAEFEGTNRDGMRTQVIDGFFCVERQASEFQPTVTINGA